MAKVPLNIPNILTFVRFALIVPAVVLLLGGEIFISLAIFLIACITDLLDGAIARKYNMISEAGMLLDPLADKLMAVSVAICFVVLDVFPVWVSVIILVKEVILIIGGIVLYTKKMVVSANTFGKLAAFSFNFALGLSFLYRYVAPWHMYIMCFSLFLMLISLIQYVYFNWFNKYLRKDQQ